MTGEIAAQLIMHTLAAHARFGERKTVIEGERRIETKVARIEAIDHHVLTIIEAPDPTHEGARRFEVFLSPNDDDDEGGKAPVKLVADFTLFAISVRYDLNPVSTDLLLRQDLPPDSWLAPISRAGRCGNRGTSAQLGGLRERLAAVATKPVGC